MFTRSCFAVFLGLSGLGGLGCGGVATKAPAAANDSPAPITTKRDDAEKLAAKDVANSDEKVPTQCAKNDPCQPPRKWVDELCHDVYPALALYMFQQGMPWERRYLTNKRTEARNASGGATLEGWLEWDEEVLVLRVRKAERGGMQVSGSGDSYDALRWNGSCVTLDSSEVTSNVPPSPKAAEVTWRILDDNIQEAMKEDTVIRETARDWRKECKGAASGEVSKACEKLGKKMSALVVGYVRNGGKVPLTSKLP